MLSEHQTDAEIKDMIDLCGTPTAADYRDWSAVMGKYTNDSYPKEAFSYEDVAMRWAECWSHDFFRTTASESFGVGSLHNVRSQSGRD